MSEKVRYVRSEVDYADPIVVLSPEEFDRIIADLENPSPPTESILRGAELLRKLYHR